MHAPAVGFVLAAALVLAAPSAAQDVIGRVVDERSRQGLADVRVSLHAADRLIAEAVTDQGGFFRLRAGGAGEYRIEVEREGYAAVTADVRVGEQDVTIPAVVLRTQVFELDPVEARARAERTAVAPAGFARAGHVMAGERLARLERHGARTITAVRELNGLHVKEYTDPGGRSRVCIESRRRMPTFNESADCHWVVIVIDGTQLGGDPERTFRELTLTDYESIEYVTPVEAGNRYGMDASANGALVLWTRGRGPHADPARNRDS